MTEKHSKWWVALEGHGFDLEELRDRLTSPHLRVVRDEATFFLESATFEGLTKDVDVQDEARRLMRLINSAARLRSRSFRNVEIGSQVVELTPGGKKVSAIVRPETIVARSRVSAVLVKVGEEEPASPPPGSNDDDKWLKLAEKDADVAAALESGIPGVARPLVVLLASNFRAAQTAAEARGECTQFHRCSGPRHGPHQPVLLR